MNPSLLISEILQALNQNRQYDIRPDGRVVAVVPGPQRSTKSGEITVVRNWVEELKRLVPIN